MGAAIYTLLPFSCYRRIPLLRTIGARNVFVKALGAISFWLYEKGELVPMYHGYLIHPVEKRETRPGTKPRRG